MPEAASLRLSFSAEERDVLAEFRARVDAARKRGSTTAAAGESSGRAPPRKTHENIQSVENIQSLTVRSKPLFATNSTVSSSSSSAGPHLKKTSQTNRKSQEHRATDALESVFSEEPRGLYNSYLRESVAAIRRASSSFSSTAGAGFLSGVDHQIAHIHPDERDFGEEAPKSNRKLSTRPTTHDNKVFSTKGSTKQFADAGTQCSRNPNEDDTATARRFVSGTGDLMSNPLDTAISFVQEELDELEDAAYATLPFGGGDVAGLQNNHYLEGFYRQERDHFRRADEGFADGPLYNNDLVHDGFFECEPYIQMNSASSSSSSRRHQMRFEPPHRVRVPPGSQGKRPFSAQHVVPFSRKIRDRNGGNFQVNHNQGHSHYDDFDAARGRGLRSRAAQPRPASAGVGWVPRHDFWNATSGTSQGQGGRRSSNVPSCRSSPSSGYGAPSKWDRLCYPPNRHIKARGPMGGQKSRKSRFSPPKRRLISPANSSRKTSGGTVAHYNVARTSTRPPQFRPRKSLSPHRRRAGPPVQTYARSKSEAQLFARRADPRSLPGQQRRFLSQVDTVHQLPFGARVHDQYAHPLPSDFASLLRRVSASPNNRYQGRSLGPATSLRQKAYSVGELYRRPPAVGTAHPSERSLGHRPAATGSVQHREEYFLQDALSRDMMHEAALSDLIERSYHVH
ncbi:unnamed protein product [Amoebophrya sp. A120]|nr:unnamed protein product [Amoebophrya sp. A120]|eukprot:GSA120T00011493001.1